MADWTTDDMRGWLTSDSRFNPYGQVRQGERFDAWLAQVKAEAWEAGYRTGRNVEFEDPAFYTGPKNPYTTTKGK